MASSSSKTLDRWLSLAPAYVWLLLLGFIPLLIMLGFSFLNDVPLGNREVFFTFENYLQYVERGFYSRLTLRSLLLGFYTTLGCLLLGYPLAYALARAVKGRWQGALFLLIIVPFWSNSLVRLYSWVIVLQNGGIIDVGLSLIGIEAESLLFTYTAALIGLIHAYLPYMVLTIYIALDRIDRSLLEASASLGARPARTFIRVVLPLSMPGVLAGVILVLIPAIGSFVEPRLLGGAGMQVLGTIIEDQFVESFNWPLGAALSFILLIIVLLLMGLAVLINQWRSRLRV